MFSKILRSYGITSSMFIKNFTYQVLKWPWPCELKFNRVPCTTPNVYMMFILLGKKKTTVSLYRLENNNTYVWTHPYIPTQLPSATRNTACKSVTDWGACFVCEAVKGVHWFNLWSKSSANEWKLSQGSEKIDQVMRENASVYGSATSL